MESPLETCIFKINYQLENWPKNDEKNLRRKVLEKYLFNHSLAKYSPPGFLQNIYEVPTDPQMEENIPHSSPTKLL